MDDQAQLLYLEPDDEITSVVRRLRETDAPRVVLVASGRTKATTSAVALRLLAEVATEEGREVVLVADASARALAGEAGIPAFASVGDANTDGAVPMEPAAPRRAPIHVVRGEPAPAAPLPALVPTPMAGDETQAVQLPPPIPTPSRSPRRLSRRVPRAALGAVVVLLLLATAGVAAVLPAANITIAPATVSVGPRDYAVRPVVQGPDTGELSATVPGRASGVFHELIPATGSVTFLNWNTVAVSVPAGTEVSAGGGPRFATLEQVTVPSGRFLPDGRVQAGEASVGVSAVEAGPGGNVAAEAIDTIENPSVRAFLRGFPNNSARLVINPAATSGGADNPLPVIEQADVDAVFAQITAELTQTLGERLAERPERLYPAGEPPAPEIVVPEGTVGSQGEPTFELTGRLTYSQPYVLRADVEADARAQLSADLEAVPSGMSLLPETIEVEIGAVVADGEALTVPVSVRARATPTLDEEALPELLAGKTADEVRAALAGLGDVTVDLWPAWVDRVPRLTWRIQLEVDTPTSPMPSPQPS
jgi:hypothetical protein